jgi:2-polyprenyl-6-methoxyphenol hydroxylase-like FAD-dependent oxidoreductase
MRVLICGAGIAGLTLACCLEERGHDVLLVERSPRLRDEGFMLDFFGPGYDAAERLGILPDLAAIHDPVERLVLLDARGRQRCSLPYRVLRERLFENRHFNFMRGDLERVLYRKIQRRLAVRFATTVDSFERTGRSVAVHLSDGTAETADLLVGADGAHSRIRRLAFGEECCFMRQLGYKAAAFVIAQPPGELDIGRGAITVTVPKRHVTVYPIRGRRLATFFLHKAEGRWDKLSVDSACAELRDVYGDLHWIVRRLLRQCDSATEVYFESVAQVEVPCWSRDRIVLVGDACQSVSPLAGQGASMAVAAALILADELTGTADLTEALRNYEQRMKPAIERQQRAGRRMASWLVPPDAARLTIRNLITQTSTWPLVASVIRSRMAARSVCLTPRDGAPPSKASDE